MARYTDQYVHEFSTSGEGKLGAAMQKQGAALQEGASKWSTYVTAAAAVGPRIEAAGESVLNFAQQNVALYKEAERVDQVLTSIYAKRGMADQVADAQKFASQLQQTLGLEDEVTKSTMGMMVSYGMTNEQTKEFMPLLAAQSDVFRRMGTDVEQVGNMVGRAFGSGNYAMLRRSGITMDEATVATLEQASALRKSGNEADIARGRQMGYTALMNALKNYTGEATDRLKTLDGQQARFNANLEETRERIGEGVGGIQRLAYAYGSDLLVQLQNADAGLLKLAGEIMYVGGLAGKYGGKGLSIAGDVMQLVYLKQMRDGLTGATKGKNLLKKATDADIIAERTKTGVAKGEAMALSGVTKEARIATAANTALSKSGALIPGAGAVAKRGLVGGMRGELNQFAAGVPGIGGTLAAPVGAAGGIVGAATTVTLVAGTAILGWEVGSAIAKWLEDQTGYQEKGGNWLANQTNNTQEMEKRAGQSYDTRSQAAIDAEIRRGTGDVWGGHRRARTSEELTQEGVLPEAVRQRRLARMRGENTSVTADDIAAARARRLAFKPGQTAQQAGGDLQGTVTFTIPRQQVLTQQSMQDYSRAR